MYSLLFCSFSFLHSMFTCCDMGPSMGCKGTTCFTMVLSMGCMEISAPAAGAPPPLLLHCPLGCFSHLSPSSLLSQAAAPHFFLNPFLNLPSQKCNGLSFGQQQVCFGAGWNCLCPSQEQLLVSSHRGHPYSPSAPPSCKHCHVNPTECSSCT